MRVIRAKGNMGWELWDGVRFIGHFKSHSQAWREADKRKGETLNRAQDVSDWISRKDA